MSVTDCVERMLLMFNRMDLYSSLLGRCDDELIDLRLSRVLGEVDGK